MSLNLYVSLLALHLLGAMVWTGGHLVLALAVLPRVMRERSVARLRDFEAGFERVGMPALLLQVATGLGLAHLRWPHGTALADLLLPATWQLPGVTGIVLKLALLAATVIAAIDARFRLIPHLSPATLPAMARRIGLVTVLGVGFVLTGLGLRFGL
ncbi:MAG: hypothetical protein RLY78_3904 [Pseudomonadota bacterium]|jgi:uncharacterized membrane protein|uniref:Copper resistance protein CopD n=1 Tax=Pseudaquabacterium rugosum TaxID=2984194 RepID=A0ABU9BGK7_9BURK